MLRRCASLLFPQRSVGGAFTTTSVLLAKRKVSKKKADAAAKTQKKSKERFYVVLEGRKRGVFESWEETEKLVKGYSHGLYRSETTRRAAKALIDEHLKSKNVEARETERAAKKKAKKAKDSEKAKARRARGKVSAKKKKKKSSTDKPTSPSRQTREPTPTTPTAPIQIPSKSGLLKRLYARSSDTALNEKLVDLSLVKLRELRSKVGFEAFHEGGLFNNGVVSGLLRDVSSSSPSSTVPAVPSQANDEVTLQQERVLFASAVVPLRGLNALHDKSLVCLPHVRTATRLVKASGSGTTGEDQTRLDPPATPLDALYVSPFGTVAYPVSLLYLPFLSCVHRWALFAAAEVAMSKAPNNTALGRARQQGNDDAFPLVSVLARLGSTIQRQDLKWNAAEKRTISFIRHHASSGSDATTPELFLRDTLRRLSHKLKEKQNTECQEMSRVAKSTGFSSSAQGVLRHELTMKMGFAPRLRAYPHLFARSTLQNTTSGAVFLCHTDIVLRARDALKFLVERLVVPTPLTLLEFVSDWNSTALPSTATPHDALLFEPSNHVLGSLREFIRPFAREAAATATTTAASAADYRQVWPVGQAKDDRFVVFLTDELVFSSSDDAFDAVVRAAAATPSVRLSSLAVTTGWASEYGLHNAMQLLRTYLGHFPHKCRVDLVAANDDDDNVEDDPTVFFLWE